MIFLLKKDTRVLFSKVLWAGNPYTKMKGLLGKKYLDKEEALIFPQAPSIHTFFMKFAIDIVFLDPSKKVVACLEKVKPNRILPFIKSRYTIEMPEDSIKDKAIQLGDQLLWEESGQTLLEFALLIGTLILSLAFVWPQLASVFSTQIRFIMDYLVDF